MNCLPVGSMRPCGIAGSPLEAAVREVAERVDVFEIDEALGLLQALQTQLEGRTGATPP